MTQSKGALEAATRAREEVAANWIANFAGEPVPLHPDLLAMIEQAAFNAATWVAATVAAQERARWEAGRLERDHILFDEGKAFAQRATPPSDVAREGEGDAERAHEHAGAVLYRVTEYLAKTGEWADEDIAALRAALEATRWRDIYRSNCLRQATKIAELREQRDAARAYLIRNVLQPLHPHIEPAPDLIGVCTQVDNVTAGLRAERDAAVAEARRALELIAKLGGKTLMMVSDDPHEVQAYSEGAYRAFEQCADIARAALASAPPAEEPPLKSPRARRGSGGRPERDDGREVSGPAAIFRRRPVKGDDRLRQK